MSHSTNPTIKQRQVAHLSQQLQRLSSQVDELKDITITTAEQAAYMRLLGGYHASWSVRTHRGAVSGWVR